MTHFNKVLRRWQVGSLHGSVAHRLHDLARSAGEQYECDPAHAARTVAGAKLGVAVQGSRAAWPGTVGRSPLPRFDALNQQRQYIDVFNRGRPAFDFAACRARHGSC